MPRYRARYFHGNDPDDEFGDWQEFDSTWTREDYEAQEAHPIRRFRGRGQKIVDEDGEEVYTYYPDDYDEDESGSGIWWVLAVIAAVVVVLFLLAGN
jgi:hypothetical protein